MSKQQETPKTTKTLPLNNGRTIPAIGFGAMETGMLVNHEEGERITQDSLNALKAGYRLIDTAAFYETEAYVGAAVRRSGIPRSEITVVSKIWVTEYGRVAGAFEDSLARLGLEYVDMYLMHWPNAMTPDKQPLPIEASPTFVEVWKEMEKLVGPRCRAVGVANFTQRTLEALLPHCAITPAVNQIQVSPIDPNTELVPYCQKHGIQVMCWAPVLGGPKSLYGPPARAVFEDQQLTKLAAAHAVDVGSLLLSWLYTRGIIPIPHSVRPDRLDANLRLFELAPAEVDTINGLYKTLGFKRLLDLVLWLWQDDVIPGKGRTFQGWTVQEMGWEDDSGNVIT